MSHPTSPLGGTLHVAPLARPPVYRSHPENRAQQDKRKLSWDPWGNDRLIREGVIGVTPMTSSLGSNQAVRSYAGRGGCWAIPASGSNCQRSSWLVMCGAGLLSISTAHTS